MFWADKLLEDRSGSEWINDAWTPSGIIHMGGLKGPVIHDVLFRVVKEQGREVKFTFGFDDFDPIDGLPADLIESHTQYMGIPISMAPSPDGNGTFGEYYGKIMERLFKELGIKAEIYWASDYYKKGIYNDAIKKVLDEAPAVRKVYEDMYKKELPSDWFPFQVVCSNCGKLGTTKVTAWDGKEVSYTCEPHLVKWAEGCGHTGKISPFDGNGKMPFKVEWAAKWWTFGVTIEGAGKDHASAGGTYDVARKIVKDVFGQEPPLKLPYEFFLSGGKKMSSSKGLGLNGVELLEVIPPEIVRFLMIKTDPNKAVEFSPFGTLIIPKLYEDFFAAAEEFKNGEKTEAARAFELSLIDNQKEYKPFRFLTLAQWVQMPNMEGEIEKEGLTEWAKYAKVWVEKFAPESEKFGIKKELPEEAKSLSEEQKQYLRTLAESLNPNQTAEEIQVKVYDLSKEMNLASKDAFAAIYISLLGKNHGPKAGWIIKSSGVDFVKERFERIG
jgi:lysyl-tRNA synthetase class 1